MFGKNAEFLNIKFGGMSSRQRALILNQPLQTTWRRWFPKILNIPSETKSS